MNLGIKLVINKSNFYGTKKIITRLKFILFMLYFNKILINFKKV